MRAIDLQGLKRRSAGSYGAPPRLEWLPIDQLVIDEEYQRPIGRANRDAIQRIADQFDWSKFSVVVVSPIGGDRYAIIDGQHRTHAAALCGLDRVPCQILRLDRAGQAASFAAINGAVTKITPWQIFKAALAAGTPWARAAHEAVEKAGCRLMTYNKSSAARQAGEVYGVNMIRDMIEDHGAETVTAALGAYRRGAYGDLPLAWGNVYINAWLRAVATSDMMQWGDGDLIDFQAQCDILELDDIAVAEIRKLRRDGEPAPARHVRLTGLVLEVWDTFTEGMRENSPADEPSAPGPAIANSQE
jgi:ribosomal protein L18E